MRDDTSGVTLTADAQATADTSSDESLHARDYEGLFDRWKELHRRAHEARTLVRQTDVPVVDSRQGRSQFYVMPHFDELSLAQWVVFVRDLGSGVPGGRHRHQGGIALFALEGHGYSIIEGERYDWAAGDVVYLPLVPGGLDHQHFAATIGEPAKFMGIIYEPLIVAVGAEMTQLTPTEGAGAPTSPVRTRPASRSNASDGDTPTLEALLDTREKQRETVRPPLLIEGSQLAEDPTELGSLRWYCHPSAAGFGGTSPILLFTQEVDPETATAELHCPGNGFAYVLEGEPEIRVDDEIHTVATGDLVCLPPRREGVRYSVKTRGAPARVLVALANLGGLGGIALGSDFAIHPRRDEESP